MGERGNRSDRPRVGISLCLLGEEVRHDGGHKHDRYATGVLGQHFQWVPVCPEVEVGMGTPREPVNLLRTDDGVIMRGIRSGKDWTEQMQTYSRQRVEALREADLHGFILKKDSPTCGMERVRLYDKNNVPSRDGVGLFAQALMDQIPNLPLEEEGRLNDKPLRENFITRVYAYHRWRTLLQGEVSPHALVEFHTGHKMLLLAHSPQLYTELGRLVAQAGTLPLDELLDSYESMFMRALAKPASPGRQVNALQHLMGYLKEDVSADDKAELNDVIQEYREGIVPLIVPLTLLRHHLRQIDDPWVAKQVYLQPYPRELALRSFYS
jgi:uncharacterized protein YbgA (DUF1722 family)/uncharacterized protein YbbK (DUF523 family)